MSGEHEVSIEDISGYRRSGGTKKAKDTNNDDEDSTDAMFGSSEEDLADSHDDECVSSDLEDLPYEVGGSPFGGEGSNNNKKPRKKKSSSLRSLKQKRSSRSLKDGELEGGGGSGGSGSGSGNFVEANGSNSYTISLKNDGEDADLSTAVGMKRQDSMEAHGDDDSDYQKSGR